MALEKNLTTLNNGFFNGVNLVMSYSPIKSKKIAYKLTDIDDNNNTNNINKEPDLIYSNGYNFIPTNLPLFLRDKYHL